MNKKTKTVLGALALLLVAGVAWAMFGRDTVVDEMHREAQQVFSGDSTDEQRRDFRERVGQLTEAQRRALFERGRPEMQKRIAQRMNDIMNLPPEELRQEVSDRADAVIALRAERPRGVTMAAVVNEGAALPAGVEEETGASGCSISSPPRRGRSSPHSVRW